MAKKVPVLNWFEKNDEMINGLRGIFRGRPRWFVTVRLGQKWADKLNPGDRIAISISDDEKNPKIIGYTLVDWVKKSSIDSLNQHELLNNIGAKSSHNIWQDMQKVYGKSIDFHKDTVSVIALTVDRS